MAVVATVLSTADLAANCSTTAESDSTVLDFSSSVDSTVNSFVGSDQDPSVVVSRQHHTQKRPGCANAKSMEVSDSSASKHVHLTWGAHTGLVQYTLTPPALTLGLTITRGPKP
jgi:hypothetical protein